MDYEPFIKLLDEFEKKRTKDLQQSNADFISDEPIMPPHIDAQAKENPIFASVPLSYPLFAGTGRPSDKDNPELAAMKYAMSLLQHSWQYWLHKTGMRKGHAADRISNYYNGQINNQQKDTFVALPITFKTLDNLTQIAISTLFPIIKTIVEFESFLEMREVALNRKISVTPPNNTNSDLKNWEQFYAESLTCIAQIYTNASQISSSKRRIKKSMTLVIILKMKNPIH